MMIIRRSRERGHVEYDWLDTYHTFSFGRYMDPEWMGFGPLRVINEDRIQGNQGFAEHFHDNMEILTYVVAGAIAHKDSLGNGSTIRPNEMQYMSAGTGIMHSEFNPESATAHLFQIWIIPNERNAKPRYSQEALKTITGSLELMASSDGRDRSIALRQDADVYRGVFKEATTVTLESKPGRLQWIHVISGSAAVQGEHLSSGDACGIEHETEITLKADADTHVLIFDMTDGSI